MRSFLDFRSTSILAATISFLFSADALAQSASVAIVDASDSVAAHVKDLASLGVVVIGRYYGRCPQWTTPTRNERLVPEKRMIDNPSEMKAILDDNRLGILSVYQFYSRDEKFDTERSSRGVQLVDDQPRNPGAKTVQDFNDCFSPERPNTIEEDARLDANAAVAQAREIIKQPAGTAIYFGVDFNLNPDRMDNVVKYFQVLKKIVTDAGYDVGVYGNGAISDLLYGQGLVKYVWLTASSSHAGSARTYNEKHWDLLQTKTDTNWLINGKPVSLDTDIQNPESTNVGLWNKAGSVIVPHERNVAVHAARRFVCQGKPIAFDDAGTPLPEGTPKACVTTFGIAVRALQENASRGLAQVDCDEDLKPDGWMKKGDLSVKRPIWVDDKDQRDKTHCVRP